MINMAEICNVRTRAVVLLTLMVVLPWTALPVNGLTTTFYDSLCPNLQSVALSAFQAQLAQDARVGASILRLHFHDCFVQGCDGSVLLDDNATFTGEKTAGPNANSLRGFSAIDAIKAAVENSCPGMVTCADLLALLARDAVAAAGGPSWTVEFGRFDGVTASFAGANANLPSPNMDTPALISSFANQGLSAVDMVTLAGAHTIGKTQCGTINARLYNWQGTGAPDPILQQSYLGQLQGECPNGGPTSTTVDNDPSTDAVFDNSYYSNLFSNRGTFHSDQALQSDGGSTAGTVGTFAGSQNQFFGQFVSSMLNMGRIPMPTGSFGEVRLNCRKAN